MAVSKRHLLYIWLVFHVKHCLNQELTRRVGKMQEVFAWKQLTYNINGNMVLRDRFGGEDLENENGMTEMESNDRVRRQMDSLFFNNNDNEENENNNPAMTPSQYEDRFQSDGGSIAPQRNYNRPTEPNRRPNMNQRPGIMQFTTPVPTTTRSPNDNADANRFFIQYNNVPMGVEKYGHRLFVTVPRRRYGIPSTLNYLDLNLDSRSRSPGLRPYPNLALSRNLISVYRTRVDECNRLWMIDTGRLEIPNQQQQIQPPAIVVFDLTTDRQIYRYQFKDSDLPQENTPTGLASITVDVFNGDCSNAYAYVPDLTSYGLIVFSLRENDSWRLSNNYFSFNPTSGNLNIGGQRFQWSDGVFSITLSSANDQGCRTAYFHPLVSTQEFSISTCDLRDRSFSNNTDAWQRYSIVGDRGSNTQSTMHGYHSGSRVIFYSEVGRNAVSCWQTSEPLIPANVAILAQDSQRMQYPSDLHVTGDEVWVMANSLPRFGYSRLDTNEYNFYIYRGNVEELVSGTVCQSPRSMMGK